MNVRCAESGKAGRLRQLQAAGIAVPDFDVSPPQLATTVERLGFPLVVRSSATIEDGHELSYAGQFRSFLRLRNVDEVEQAIQCCLKSAESPEVQQYCARQGIDPADLRVDCIVQRMIQPELAGVMFTWDPVRGTDEIVVNACEGLADELLSGRQAPLPENHPLLQKYLPQLTAVGRRIEQHFGAPQDIEFAIQDGRVFVLQTRPITRIHFEAIDGEWTNANFRDGGVSSGICSPLMSSLYALIWDWSIKHSLRQTCLWQGDFEAGRSFFSRPYWNLAAVKQCLMLIPGFVERDFDEDLGVAVRYDGPGRSTPWTWRTALRALPIAIGVRRFLRRQKRAAQRWLSTPFDSLRNPYNAANAQRTWLRLIERDYFEIETDYFRSVFAVSLVKQEFKMAYPGCDYGALVSGLPPLRHMAPIRRMREALPNDRKDVAALVQQFPHPSRWGLDVRFPRWDEELEFVAEIWNHLPPFELRDPALPYEKAKAEALRALTPHRRRTFLRKLERLREFVRLREDLRDVSTRMYHLIRTQARHIAQQRGIGDDIFQMTYQEVVTDDRSQVERRRAEMARFRNFRAPQEIGRGHRSDISASRADWKGIAASSGIARGTARVAHSIDEAARLPAGSILVCPCTEPSWTTILDRFAAVVTETGGQLSHAAVLCREFGIPAVLGVSDATITIRDGQAIVVDGGQGVVILAS